MMSFLEYTDKSQVLICCIVIWSVLRHTLNQAQIDVRLEFRKIRVWKNIVSDQLHEVIVCTFETI